MNGVAIKYGDIAPEAKENFVPEVEDKESFVNLTQLQQYNLSVLNYANPCEKYNTLFDGNALVFPQAPENENMCFLSKSICGAEGIFPAPIVLTLTSQGNYTSKGFTFTFDNHNNIFCNDLNIKWYQGETLLEDEDFIPTSAFYFCHKEVEYFNKVVITFKKMNMPYNRLRLFVIDYGYGTYFKGDELKGVNVIQEIDPVSETIVMNVCDFSLDSKTDMNYNFQTKQPLTVYFNNKLVATQFVETSKRVSKRQWEIQTFDYIGVLGRITFTGGMYVNQNAKDLLENIFSQAKIPLQIDESLHDKVLNGYIPICSCREAVQKICFAIGAVCDTSNSDKVNIFSLNLSTSQHILKSRIKQGQSFEYGDKITEVSLTQYTYTPTTTEDEMVELYNNTESGERGENIFVTFNEPIVVETLRISSGGEIVQSGVNYAIINVTGLCSMAGNPYKETTAVKSKRNSDVLAIDIANVKEITGQTLISESNVEEILNLVLAYYSKREQTSLAIYENYHINEQGERVYDAAVNVGDIITCDTEYLGILEGRIKSARFDLNGGVILKECEMV